MSVYREPATRRARAAGIAAVVGLLLGALAGFLVGRASVEEPSLGEQIGEVQEEIRPGLNALELVGIEYPEGVRGGRVVAETEYRAAESQADSAAAAVDAARQDLELLSPAGTRRASRIIAELQRLIGERAEPGAVQRAAREASSSLEASARIE
jgi:hypothetical protein